MKKILLLIQLFLFISPITFSQQRTVDLFYEKKTNGWILYGYNNEYYPVSLTLNINVTNMRFSEKFDKYLVIPPRTSKHKLGEFTALNTRAKYTFKYTYLYYPGDYNVKTYDQFYEYDLPFKKGKSVYIIQGYNGKFSHQNQKSLDFDLKEGDEILAARGGTVVQLVQNNNQHCTTKDCAKYNNYITIMHNDGTYASYLHIMQNGAAVKLGERVEKSQLIAYSGNTGWSVGPHLHFMVYFRGLRNEDTVETGFRIDKGDKYTVLYEKYSYKRNY